jgi:hypothetical protein
VAASGGLLDPAGAPAVDVAQRSLVGHSLGELAGASEAKEQSMTEAICRLLEFRSPAVSNGRRGTALAIERRERTVFDSTPRCRNRTGAKASPAGDAARWLLDRNGRNDSTMGEYLVVDERSRSERGRL